MGSGLRQVQGGLAEVPEQLPHHGRSRHRRSARCAEADAPGHLRRRLGRLGSSSSRLPGGSPSRPGGRLPAVGPSDGTRRSHTPPMSESTEAFPTAVAPARRVTLLGRPSVREAAWGVVFVGPWLIGLILFTAGPMIASLVMSLTSFDLVHPEAVRFVGIDNYVRLAGDPSV